MNRCLVHVFLCDVDDSRQKRFSGTPLLRCYVETSRALNGIAISEKRVATFSPGGRERRRRKQSRCKAKRSVHGEGLGKREEGRGKVVRLV